MKNRARAAVQAVGGFGVSVALVVGIPLLLIMLAGNPFPTSVPSLDAVVETLTQSGSGLSEFVIGGLAILLWLLWAQIVLAFVVEMVATLRRRQTRRLPTLPGIQTLAARLVASMTLASTLATVPVFAPAAGALNLASIEPTILVHAGEPVASTTAAEPESTEVVAAATTVSDEPAPLPVHLQVSRSTELWDIAESVFGDGIAWKQIAQTNRGRTASNGAAITTETETVPAGTVLVLLGVTEHASTEAFGQIIEESDTVPRLEADQGLGADLGSDENDGTPEVIIDLRGELAAVPPTSVDFADAVRVVEPGDTIWAFAEEVVEQRAGREASAADVAPYWAEVVDANRERIVSGDVDLIYPGEKLLLPGAPASAQAADADAGLPSEPHDDSVSAFDPAVSRALGELRIVPDIADQVPVQSAPAERAPAERASAERVDPRASDPIEPDVTTQDVAGAAASAVTELNSVQPAAAPVPSPTLSSPASKAATRDDRAATPTDDTRLPTAPVGLVAFGSAMIAASVVVAIRHRRSLQKRQRPEGELPIQPSTAAAAFEAALLHSSSDLVESQQGAGWRMLPASVVEAVAAVGQHELHIEPAGTMTAVPLSHDANSPLVPVPVDPSDTPDGHSVDDSPPYASASIVVGTDLATGDALLLDLGSAGAIEIEGDASAVRRFVRTAMLDLAVSNRADDLVIIGVGTGAELQELERVRWVATFADALSQTVRCGHAGPTRTPVVVVASEAPPDDDHMVEALRELDALLLAPGIDAPVRVAISGDRASIWPDGSTVVLSALSDAGYAATAELIDCTSVSATESVAPTAIKDTGLDVVAASDCPTEQGPIEVQVLGPVIVDGATPFSSLKATDVIAYLAFHRNGADADQIKTWVWPAYDPPSDKAFANVLSRARTGLGANDAGEPYVSRAGSDKTYRLNSSVTTDFDRFRGFVTLADNAESDDHALEHLRQALSLIRGVPFSGGGASSFAWADNHVRAHIEFTIDETVHRCADLALAMGELETARWAARKGLELVPGCEQCFRRRFLVAGADQNRTELRRAMADLERSASADLGEPESVDAISHELLDLYQQLDRDLVAGAS